MSPEQQSHVHHVSRKVEDYGLIVAFGLGACYGLSEIVVHAVVSLGVRPRVDAPFPWIIVMFFLGCILPKTLGRATTGSVWIILAQAVGRLISRGKNGKVDPLPAIPGTVEIAASCAKCGKAMSVCVCPEEAA